VTKPLASQDPSPNPNPPKPRKLPQAESYYSQDNDTVGDSHREDDRVVQEISQARHQPVQDVMVLDQDPGEDDQYSQFEEQDTANQITDE
jgi:hypothetical protein